MEETEAQEKRRTACFKAGLRRDKELDMWYNYHVAMPDSWVITAPREELLEWLRSVVRDRKSRMKKTKKALDELTQELEQLRNKFKMSKELMDIPKTQERAVGVLAYAIGEVVIARVDETGE